MSGSCPVSDVIFGRATLSRPAGCGGRLPEVFHLLCQVGVPMKVWAPPLGCPQHILSANPGK